MVEPSYRCAGASVSKILKGQEQGHIKCKDILLSLYLFHIPYFTQCKIDIGLHGDGLVRKSTRFSGISHTGKPSSRGRLSARANIVSTFIFFFSPLCFQIHPRTSSPSLLSLSWAPIFPLNAEGNRWPARQAEEQLGDGRQVLSFRVRPFFFPPVFSPPHGVHNHPHHLASSCPFSSIHVVPTYLSLCLWRS